MVSAGDIFLAVLAILFPPIAVWIKRGICSGDSLLNLLLCLLGYLPGLLHAWYVIAKYPDEDLYQPVPYGEGYEAGGRVIYFAPGDQGQRPAALRREREGRREEHGGYGTVAPGMGAGEGGSQGPSAPAEAPPLPPTYEDAVRGDNKVQR